MQCLLTYRHMEPYRGHGLRCAGMQSGSPTFWVHIIFNSVDWGWGNVFQWATINFVNCDKCGTGDTAKWLRVYTALSEDLGSVSRAHSLVMNLLEVKFRGTRLPLVAFLASCMHVVHIHLHRFTYLCANKKIFYKDDNCKVSVTRPLPWVSQALVPSEG